MPTITDTTCEISNSSESTNKLEASNHKTIADTDNIKKENGTQEKVETLSDDEAMKKDAISLLSQGKRHLLVRDFQLAASTLGDACSKYSELYGELGDECGEAYFNYGCALLELSREEGQVLTVDKDKAGSENEEEDEDDQNSTKDEPAVEGNEEAGSKNENDEKKTEDIEGNENKSEKDVTEDDSNHKDDKDTRNDENNEKDYVNDEDKENSKFENNVDAKHEQPAEETLNDGDSQEDDEEEVNNLQLAWELFELSKVIFTKLSDEKRLSETYLKLGEVAMESENYDTALADIQSCLDMQNKFLPPVSREIAETLFQLGVACSLCNQFDQSIKHFTAAGAILEKRIQCLKKMTEPEPEKAKNPFYTIEKEIKELEMLLPEIKEKIIDMEEFKSETMKVVAATINGSGEIAGDGAGPSKTNLTKSEKSTSGPFAASNSSAQKTPANDISHLVKKRKSLEEESSNNLNVSKKARN